MIYISRQIIRSPRSQLEVAVRRFGDEATVNKSKGPIWKREEGFWGYIFGAGFFVAWALQVVSTYGLSDKEVLDNTKQELERFNLIASNLENAKVSPSRLTLARPIIDRPGIETALQEAMNSKSPEFYSEQRESENLLYSRRSLLASLR